MAERPPAVLVYNRIDENRRNTWFLIAAFVVLIVPLPTALMLMLPLAPSISPYAWYSPFLMWVFLTSGFAALVNVLPVSTSLLLRRVGARRISREEQPALWRTVENLCIGAGLPPPALYVVESPAANAFATGHNPDDASLVITSGLLSLLTPRELAGVIAHELSHVGNCDTRLGTVLATTVATLRLPLTIVAALIVDLDLRRSLVRLLPFLAFVPVIVLGLFLGGHLVGTTAFVGATLTRLTDPRVVTIGIAVAYALVGAPFLATCLRWMISQEREFLADADAVLLTRDPTALALALAKVGQATGNVRASAATAHLYFVDPRPANRPWWDPRYQLHPPIPERIDRVGAMSQGIPPRELDAAGQTGKAYAEEILTDSSQAVDDPSHAIGSLDGILGRSKATIWRQVARDIGGNYQDGGSFGREVLRYRSGECEITLDTFEQGNDESTTIYTRMTAPFENKHALYFKMYRVGCCASIGTLFGMQDIQIGDPSFDDDFIIQGNDDEKIRWLLNDATIKDRIQEAIPRRLFAIGQPALGSAVFGARYPDQLFFQCSGVVKDEDLLKNQFQLFVVTFARLAQIESSSKPAMPPRGTLMYEKPDGWSQVLCELPENAAVTVLGTEGPFLKVTTAERVVGYIAQSRRGHVIARPEG
jgi:heat shock protein HtpX